MVRALWSSCCVAALLMGQVAAQEGLTSRDNAAVAAALLDLRTPGTDSPLDSGLGPSGPPFPVASDSIRCALPAKDVLRDLDLKGLTRRQASGAREAAKHLGGRRAGGRFTLVADGFELLDRYRSVFDRSIHACVPGFSKDGRLAIVLMEVQWGMHPLPTAHLLLFENGVWRVLLRGYGPPNLFAVG